MRTRRTRTSTPARHNDEPRAEEKESATSFGPVAPKNSAPGLASVLVAHADCFRREDRDWSLICLPEFLKCTCLTYCEFYELWKSGFVKFTNAGGGTATLTYRSIVEPFTP